MPTSETFVSIAKASEIPVGAFKPVEVQGKQLLICHTDGGFYAVDDT